MTEAMQLPLIEVRDRRQKEWFWVDNTLLDEYARVLGPNATLVYMALARHSDNDLQTCWPSMELIAEECGIKSRNTVAKGIKKLQEYNMIGVHESSRPDGKRNNNVYTLVTRRHWKPVDFIFEPKHEEQMTDRPEQSQMRVDGLPENVHPEIWDEWVEHRKQIRKKLTPNTIKRQLKQLEGMGPDANDSIMQSITNGWTGLFPVRKAKKEPTNRQPATSGKYNNVGTRV